MTYLTTRSVRGVLLAATVAIAIAAVPATGASADVLLDAGRAIL